MRIFCLCTRIARSRPTWFPALPFSSPLQLFRTPSLQQHLADACRPSLFPALQVLVDVVAEGLFNPSKRWLIAALFVVVVSFGVSIGVGILFFMQLQQVGNRLFRLWKSAVFPVSQGMR